MIIIRQMYYYFEILILWNLLNKLKCYELTNNSALDKNPNYFVGPKFPLVKCYCGADSIWESGRCMQGNTTVEFLLGFSPSLLTMEISTSDFKEVVLRRPNCSSTMILPTIKNVLLTRYKTLFHTESGENFTDNYCVENIKDKKGNVILVAEVCIQSLVIPICCPVNQYLNISTLQCNEEKRVKRFQPPVFIGSTLLNATKVSPYFQHFPSCNPKYFEKQELNVDSGKFLQYQRSQVLFFQWDQDSVESFPKVKYPQDYCIASGSIENGGMYSILLWNELSPLYCSNKSEVLIKEEICEEIMNWLLLPSLILSTVFLLLILCLHAAMPEFRKSLGSKITICHVASLFCGFCLLLLIQKVPPPFHCKLYGPMIQVCFLATFFWLNVMCFDIWWKLRCRRPAGETVQSSRLLFLRYSLYAWGLPLTIGGVTVAMDNIPGLGDIHGIIIPGFGQKHCWFTDKSSALAYYFGIIAFLMAANVFFSLWVFVILFRANCTYNKVLKNNQDSSGRTWIYFKIFGVMGITWLFEILSWEEGTCKYWVITDVINALRGLMLFIIFFGNKKSIKKIQQRFSSMNQTIQDQVNRSVNSIRKLSHKSTNATTETRLESRRTSETHSAEISLRTNPQERESGMLNEGT